jgi:TPP-dependent pyruvate/acetoin dehydrogenase alpha subunit
MARIDAVIDDILEQRFRLKLTEKFGGRKGGLSRALEEAIDLWIKSDSVELLKKRLLEGGLTESEFRDTVDSLKKHGKASIRALLEVDDAAVDPNESRYLHKAIKEAPTYPT